jgi:hypothetical protein
VQTKRLLLQLLGVVLVVLVLYWTWESRYGVHEYRGTLRLYDVSLPGSTVGNAALDTGTESYYMSVPIAIASRETLQQLDGRRVVVTGKMRVRRDFEMRDRRYKVIYVETLRQEAAAP